MEMTPQYFHAIPKFFAIFIILVICVHRRVVEGIRVGSAGLLAV